MRTTRTSRREILADSCYFHEELDHGRVYFDGVKLAGPKENSKKGLLSSIGLELAPQQPLSVYLGCVHEEKVISVDGTAVDVMSYKMDDVRRASLDAPSGRVSSP